MFPGHHRAWARIIRALVRMNRKEMTKPNSTSSAAPRPAWAEELTGSGTRSPRTPLPAGAWPITHRPPRRSSHCASVFQKWLVVGLIGLRVGRGERGDGTIERIVLTQGRPPIALRSPERAWPWASVQPQISPHTKRALVPSRTCAHDEVIGLPRLGRAETFSRRF